HTRFAQHNCRAVAVQSRLHVEIFEHIVVHFAPAQLVDLSGACAHFAVRKREGEILREVTLKRGFIRIEKSLAGIALKLQHLFSAAVCASTHETAQATSSTTRCASFTSTQRRSRLSSLFCVVQVYPSLDVVATPPPVSFFCCLQIRAAFIAPATLE